MNTRPVNQIMQNLNSLQEIPVKGGTKGLLSPKVIIIAVIGVIVMVVAAVVPATVYILTRHTSSTIVTTATTVTTTSVTTATTTTSVTSSAATVTATTTTATNRTTTTTTTATNGTTSNPCSMNGLRWNMTGITVVRGLQFSRMAGMYFDANDNLYFVDEAPNQVVWRLAKNATNATIVAGTYRSLGWSATEFQYPQDVYADSRQNIFVTDSGTHRLQKFANGSRIGITAAGISRSNGSALNQLSVPGGIWFDPTETFMYIADTDNHRVIRFPTNATSGSNGLVVAGGNGPANTNTSLNAPYGVYSVPAVSNDLYISNPSGHSVIRWTPGASSGTFVAGIPGVIGFNASTLSYPMGIRVDTHQNLYVADFANHRVQLFCHNSRIGITIAGNGIAANTPTRLWNPKNIAFDSAMNLYVSDSGNNRIQKFMKL